MTGTDAETKEGDQPPQLGEANLNEANLPKPLKTGPAAQEKPVPVQQREKPQRPRPAYLDEPIDGADEFNEDPLAGIDMSMPDGVETKIFDERGCQFASAPKPAPAKDE
eukprot:GHVU01125905.1.p5 GENE.GHVU01125905.1~~GHVU01125905.1.p5  ORF type:complete len:109 (+),score=24.34 GHVU01125905.1:138-464(+)